MAAGIMEDVRNRIDLRRAMRAADRTQPGNVEQFPVVDKIERLKSKFVAANNRVVDTQCALDLAQRAYDEAIAERETARKEVLADLKNSGIFEGVSDFQKAIQDA